jgi:hypothetical protein
MATRDEVYDTDAEQFSRTVAAITAYLFAAACVLPATDIRSFDGGALSDSPSRHDPTLGFVHLLFGWMDLYRSLPPWGSNFVLWAGVVQLRRGRPGSAAILGILSFGLGLTTLTSYKSEAKYVGYYLWQASQVVFAGGSYITWLGARRCSTGKRGDPIRSHDAPDSTDGP